MSLPGLDLHERRGSRKGTWAVKVSGIRRCREILLRTGGLILVPDHVEEPNPPAEWLYFSIRIEIGRTPMRKAKVGQSYSLPANSNRRRSSITLTPNPRALSSFDPASSPATT